MSRKKSKSQQPRGKSRAIAGEGKRKEGEPASSEQAGRRLWPSAAAWRDIIESVVIAFVLAFLFRTFEAEAFVIPTGSMAPTLLGRHKDVTCPKCRSRVRVSASDEVDSATGQRRNNVDVVACTCPMCRYTIPLGRHNPQHRNYPSYKGDRILVAKFPYQFSEPKRWDVAVFKYPGGAKTNFIKRIVGLPNETILISHGDLFVKPAEPDDFERFGRPPNQHDSLSNPPEDLEPEFNIARKPVDKILAMLQPVYDNDHVLPALIEAGWPARWFPLNADHPAGGWITSDEYRSFSTDGSAEGVVWLAYRHVVPSYGDWQWLQEGLMPPDNRQPEPQLILDFSAYNAKVLNSDTPPPRTYTPSQDAPGYTQYGESYREAADAVLDPSRLGLHWVGDLAVECTMEVQSPTGEAILELVEGGRIFQCRIDVASGKATLSIDGRDEFHPTAQTDMRGPGSYRIMFSNIDDQLLLWVGRKVVRFDTATAYPRLGNTRPQPEDLRPVRIGSRGAALQISCLRIHRDIYYIAQRLSPHTRGSLVITDLLQGPSRYGVGSQQTAHAYSDPQQWDFFASTRQVAFPLKSDQFLVLGDNSAESRDSRLWENEDFDYFVSRDLLIGKALIIYWPHGWDIPGTNLPIKIVPNFGRIMRFVR